MNITNGSVTRAIRPADYETKSVTLSFVLDESDDAEALAARVMGMAERIAKGQVPTAFDTAKEIAQPAPTTRTRKTPPPPVTDEVVEVPQPHPPASTAPAPSASASAPTSVPASEQVVDPAAVTEDLGDLVAPVEAPSLQDMLTAANNAAAKKGAGGRDAILAVLREYNKDDPRMSNVPEAKRAEFIAKMAAL